MLLHDQLTPKWAWLRQDFWQISVHIAKTAQAFQWKTNRKSYVAHRMAPMLVNLNDLEGHSQVAGLFKCNPSNIFAGQGYSIHLCSILPDLN